MPLLEMNDNPTGRILPGDPDADLRALEIWEVAVLNEIQPREAGSEVAARWGALPPWAPWCVPVI